MSLRDELKEYIPMFLWEVIEHPGGYIVSAEEFNNRWNLIREQNDEQARTIKKILDMLYETLLSDTDGSIHLKVGLPALYATDNLKQVLVLIDDRLKANATAINTHKTSTDHDNRYYTKDELIPWLRGGDTYIKEEVFTIVESDTGDNTFTYTSDGVHIQTGVLLNDGSQVFTLVEGSYEPGLNRLEVFIGDTLRRTAKSGGLIEIDPYSFALTPPEGANAEITVKYYERIGMAAEYNIKLGPSKPPRNDGKNMWFEVVE